jgi:hypothetical protein
MWGLKTCCCVFGPPCYETFSYPLVPALDKTSALEMMSALSRAVAAYQVVHPEITSEMATIENVSDSLIKQLTMSNTQKAVVTDMER